MNLQPHINNKTAVNENGSLMFVYLNRSNRNTIQAIAGGAIEDLIISSPFASKPFLCMVLILVFSDVMHVFSDVMPHFSDVDSIISDVKR